ncbi:flavin reductase family protein [Nocardioides sp. AN3]
MIEATDGRFDAALLRQAFGCFPSGVTAFCGLVDGVPDGMAASSFTSLSVDPALVLVCVQNTSSTWPRLSKLSHLGLSVLASDHGTVARSLASKSGDRFADVDWVADESGAVFVHGSTLWMDCTIHSVVAGGDHQIVQLNVEALTMNPDVVPMVFHRSGFHSLAAAG